MLSKSFSNDVRIPVSVLTSTARCLCLTIALLTSSVAGNAPNIDYSHNMRILKLPKTLNPGTLVYQLRGSHPTAKVLTFGIREANVRRFLDVKSSGFRTADVYLKSSLIVSKKRFHGLWALE